MVVGGRHYYFIFYFRGYHFVRESDVTMSAKIGSRSRMEGYF